MLKLLKHSEKKDALEILLQIYTVPTVAYQRILKEISLGFRDYIKGSIAPKRHLVVGVGECGICSATWFASLLGQN